MPGGIVTTVKTDHVDAAVTADATAGGLVKIASTARVCKGATVYMNTNDGIGGEYVVMAVVSATDLKLGARDHVSGFVQPANLSAFTLVKVSRFVQPSQYVYDVYPQDIPLAYALPVRNT